MGRNLDDVIKSLPAERQAKIANLSDKKVAEMIAHATTLTDFRKAVGKTQAEVAKVLGIKQNAVSQLEQRSDTYVSTLRRFLKSLGMTLELSVIAKDGARIDLPNFLPWQDAGLATNDSQAFSVADSTPTRKAVAAPARGQQAAALAAPARQAAAMAAPAKEAVATSKSVSGGARTKTSTSSKQAGASRKS